VAAFMMLLFLIAHVYLTTTGHTPLAHIKAMITGWEEVEAEDKK
jgi:thiosulfate reductase cytochrome b subunit